MKRYYIKGVSRETGNTYYLDQFGQATTSLRRAWTTTRFDVASREQQYTAAKLAREINGSVKNLSGILVVCSGDIDVMEFTIMEQES